jgi:hypothetical protein
MNSKPISTMIDLNIKREKSGKVVGVSIAHDNMLEGSSRFSGGCIASNVQFRPFLVSSNLPCYGLPSRVMHISGGFWFEIKKPVFFSFVSFLFSCFSS